MDEDLLADRGVSAVEPLVDAVQADEAVEAGAPVEDPVEEPDDEAGSRSSELYEDSGLTACTARSVRRSRRFLAAR